MIPSLHSTDWYSCSASNTSNFVWEPNRLPTFIKTTFTALSPLAQKLYLRLCRSYIFPYISRADLLNRRFKSSTNPVEESWNCLLRFTSGHRSSLRPDSSSTPSLLLLFPPSFFFSLLFVFLCRFSTSPMTLSESCLLSLSLSLYFLSFSAGQSVALPVCNRWLWSIITPVHFSQSLGCWWDFTFTTPCWIRIGNTFPGVIAPLRW